MTPQTFLTRLNEFSQSNDPDGMLAYAEQHLLEVMPDLTASQMRRVNDLGEWAAMVVSLRELSNMDTVANSPRS